MLQAQPDPAVFHLPFHFDYPGEPVMSMIERIKSLCHVIGSMPTSVPQAAPPPPAIITPGMAMQEQLVGMLTTFDGDAAKDPEQLRRFITNNLIYLSLEGKNEATRVKCLEMLGKHKDVGLFEERSTILVANMDTDSIKAELRTIVERLRAQLPSHAVTDIAPEDMKEITHETD